jgi:hypothetical protein
MGCTHFDIHCTAQTKIIITLQHSHISAFCTQITSKRPHFISFAVQTMFSKKVHCPLFMNTWFKIISVLQKRQCLLVELHQWSLG